MAPIYTRLLGYRNVTVAAGSPPDIATLWTVASGTVVVVRDITMLERTGTGSANVSHHSFNAAIFRPLSTSIDNQFHFDGRQAFEYGDAIDCTIALGHWIVCVTGYVLTA